MILSLEKINMKYIKRITTVIFSIIIACAITVGGRLAWNLVTGNFHVVIPGIVFRSAQPDPKQLKLYIEKYHIKSVLTLRGENLDKQWYLDEVKTADQSHLDFYKLEFSSRVLPNINRLRELAKVIDESKKPILLHCLAGADRTGIASAFSIALLKNSSIKDIESQASWTYNVSSPKSSAYQVVYNYAKWLKDNNKKHSREQFLIWLNSTKELKNYRGWFL